MHFRNLSPETRSLNTFAYYPPVHIESVPFGLFGNLDQPAGPMGMPSSPLLSGVRAATRAPRNEPQTDRARPRSCLHRTRTSQQEHLRATALAH
eukprot:7385791-Prymnesium_polylepis.1